MGLSDTTLGAFDVTRLTAGGVEVLHHAERIDTDGPFLVLSTAAQGLRHIIPAHALVSVDPCEGMCRAHQVDATGKSS